MKQKLNKLEELFLPLAYTWDCYNDEPCEDDNTKKCADLATKIAVNFSLWQQLGDCEWILNDEDEWYIPSNPHVRINTQ